MFTFSKEFYILDLNHSMEIFMISNKKNIVNIHTQVIRDEFMYFF